MLQCETVPGSFGLFDYSERDVAVDQLHAATAIYTQAAVIDPLLERIGWPDPGLSLFDPSCGDGAFLVSALRMIKLQANDLRTLARIRGWEIHPQAVEHARANVANYLVSVGWIRNVANQAAHEMIVQEDFLMPERPVESYKFIAGNPPYLRFGNLPDYFKGVYSEALSVHARADLLHAFLDKCKCIVPHDGVIAFVTADRWLSNCSAAALREELGRYLGIDHICRLDPSTAFYRPKVRRQGELARVHPVEVVLRPKEFAELALSAEPVYPDGDLPESRSGKTLADICEISVGPWMGPFGIFVVDAITAKTLPSRHLIPAVDTDDLDYATGSIKRPTKFVIMTKRDTRPVETIVRTLRRTLGGCRSVACARMAGIGFHQRRFPIIWIRNG